MKLSASINSAFNQHRIVVQTDDSAKELEIPVKATGFGSSVNGGELLLLALATCFGNDIYREAAKRGIAVSAVDVVCSGEFGTDGKPGSNFTYRANVTSDASPAVIDELIRHTDRIAEVHNTLRQGLTITLTT